MAESSFPYTGNPMPVANWEALASPWGDDGVIVDYSALAVDGNSLKVVAGTGMQPVVSIGHAEIRGIRYINDAAKTLTAFPTATLDRYDRVALKYDRTIPSIVIVRVAGTEGAGVGPTLTNTSTVTYLPIAKVKARGGANSIISSDITDERWLNGTQLRSITSSVRPIVEPGAQIFERDTGRLVQYDASGNEVELLMAGGKSNVVGFHETTGTALLVSMAATLTNWVDVTGYTATIPGVTGVLYRVWARGTATQYNVDGRIGVFRSDGVILQPGRVTSAQNPSTGTYFAYAEVEWYFLGAGAPLAIKLMAQKVGGQFNWELSAPMQFVVTSGGLA